MSRITTKDGTKIYFKDWGTGKPVVFSHAWPLNADAWQAQMSFLVERGYRVIAHDRRGHGRSSPSEGGYDLNTYSDDLNELMEALDLTQATLVGHSTGGGEVTRYVGRYGTKRVAKLVLISAISPIRHRVERKPDGTPISAFEEIRSAVGMNRSQFFVDFSMPFYGFNKPNAEVAQRVREAFWHQGMQTSVLGACEGIRAFAEADLVEDLRSISVPTLILHGDQDQIVPLAGSALLSAKLLQNAKLKVYLGAPHGMPTILADEVNADLLAFLES